MQRSLFVNKVYERKDKPLHWHRKILSLIGQSKKQRPLSGETQRPLNRVMVGWGLLKERLKTRFLFGFKSFS
jgi:hypothetical protein